ncbi:ABC transporter permease [Brumicola pallidula]|jgi:ABC-2 type transport system permease protein|uniref:Antibiotic transport system permease protein n=1 Tax=Brumicola pallidula DSM 14239 = ACAM 615 TaxID=1121922 RepID=K6ZK24_9ALTE|nr:ABC transporter permease [Glaciecola pallidula]GAC30702.1 antibiotic transport system permease protein [Glaciecola pallidula DSM 14239 = ACAM 615]
MTFRAQWQLFYRDKWLFSCLTWVPILLALSIWAIFFHGTARDLPIGVVDLSHSQLSRTISRQLDASATLAVNDNYSDVSQAKNALISGDIYAYVVIPGQFDRDIYRGQSPQISAFYNSQYILVGKLVSSAIISAVGTANAQIEVLGSLSDGNTTTQSAVGRALTIRTQITPLFNKNTNYTQFLVSAIIPALWQIFIVAGTILIITANAANKGAAAGSTRLSVGQVMTTLSFYIPLFLLQGALFLLWFYVGFDWPMNGSFVALLFAQFVTCIACMIMGAFFYFLTHDAARAISVAGAFTAPSFAFMGITFPVTDMNTAALIWRSLLPISHYIEVQVSQVSYGVSWIVALTQLLPMLGYLLPLFLTYLLITKRRNSSELAV